MTSNTGQWLERVLEALERYPILEKAVALVLLALAAWFAGRVAQWVLERLVRRVIERTEFSWDDDLVKHRVFARLAHVVPAAVVYYGVGLIEVWLGDPASETPFHLFVQFTRSAAAAYAVLMVVVAVSALLTALTEIYSRRPEAHARPIKGYVQLAQIGLFVLGGVLVLATLMNRSPTILLGGLGALTAVLLLVFKDTILSLVASLQLNSNDMVRVGDWVEMPSHGVDGDVIDIALHTVKVKNFDNTVTTVPTYSFITDAFKNWRAMQDSGGRRVKRPIFFDTNSIRFLTDDDVERFRRFGLLEEYLSHKQRELAEYNATIVGGLESPQARRLTNFGTFRAYAREYLATHPQVRQDLRVLVRQLDPTAAGIPMQFYFFTKTTEWGEYEDIQSDIFDHLLAIAPQFDLRIFQQPSGSDVQKLAGRPAIAGI